MVDLSNSDSGANDDGRVVRLAEPHPYIRETHPGSGILTSLGCEDGWEHLMNQPNGSDDGFATCEKCNNDVWVGYVEDYTRDGEAVGEQR